MSRDPHEHEHHGSADGDVPHAGHGDGHPAASPAVREAREEHGDGAAHAGHGGHHPAHAAHGGHDPHAGHGGHGGHDKHAGHSVEMFRDKFWITLALTIPTLVWGHMLQDALGYTAPHFSGSHWIPPVFGTAVFL